MEEVITVRGSGWVDAQHEGCQSILNPNRPTRYREVILTSSNREVSVWQGFEFRHDLFEFVGIDLLGLALSDADAQLDRGRIFKDGAEW